MVFLYVPAQLVMVAEVLALALAYERARYRERLAVGMNFGDVAGKFVLSVVDGVVVGAVRAADGLELMAVAKVPLRRGFICKVRRAVGFGTGKAAIWTIARDAFALVDMEAFLEGGCKRAGGGITAEQELRRLVPTVTTRHRSESLLMLLPIMTTHIDQVELGEGGDKCIRR
jgi:hypothetical protein